MFSVLSARARSLRHLARLPAAARTARRLDRAGLPAVDPGSEAVLEASMRWLCSAQDLSASADGGVARDYSLLRGWASSYPETTGYIIPTFIEYARRTGSEDMRERARRMSDWLVRIQLPGGGIQGGRIDSRPVVPVTFNTGQVLLGLAAAEKEYETHVAWGLFEAERIDKGRSYGDAALANVRWALSSQGCDGWFPKCCLDDPVRPLTHTIAYALRGILEAYRFSSDSHFLAAARRT